uniref:Uncharacterized protein n=1 Tax=Glossina palpalis gambiensis TaxID=67801 RepID=A0A1B0BM69_9MUSC
MLLDFNFLQEFGATLRYFRKIASCRPRGLPKNLKTSEPIDEAIRTAEPRESLITTQELKITTNTEEITTEH